MKHTIPALLSAALVSLSTLTPLSAPADFNAWVYEYGSNTPGDAQESWTAANLVDTTAGAANATFSGAYNNEKNCFDGKTNTRWIQQARQTWVIYKFSDATKISTYGIRQATNNGYDSRVPVSWELYGSNAETAPTTADDASWVKLDTRTGVFHNYKGNNYDFGSRVMRLERTAKYRSYLLKVTSNKSDSYTVIGELEFYNAPLPNAVKFEDAPTVSYQNGAFKVAGSFYSIADCEIKAVISDGVNEVVESVGEFTGSEDTQTFDFTVPSTLDADKTYSVTFTSTQDDVTAESESVAFYNGDLSLVKVKDADEYQCEAGEITVSRASADAFDLVVPYTITAKVEGMGTQGTTWEAPAAVTIPAGETSATLIVKPKVDATIAEAVEVVVSAAPGTYIGFSPATVDVTIVNVAVPAGYNTWIAMADGLASDPDNWSEGHAPLASENVLFDGNFSAANCEWDAAAAATVASWTQRNGYTGTVTVDTVFPDKGPFTCLAVTGTMTVDSGVVTHPQSRTMGDKQDANWDWLGDLLANETYRLCLSVGSLSVGADGALDVATKGYYASHDGARCQGAHGGRFGAASPAVYGDPKEPIHIGMAHRTAGNYYNGKGGGAIYITSSGAVAVNGAVSADSGNSGHGAGAAGSVYINAPTVTGTGSITARGSATGEGNYKGCGGRVAIVTQTPVDRTTFAAISAESEWKNAQGSRATEYGGPGTVYFKDATTPNGKLVVAAKSDISAIDMTKIARQAFVGTDGDWTFDAIEFGKNSYLALPVGATLTLPDGLASVSGTGTGNALGGLLYEGGTLDIGDATAQTISGNWILTGWSNLVINADVTVDGGAAIGVPQVASVSDNGSALPVFMTSTVTVDGDLTVTADGKLLAFACGARKPNQWVTQGVLGHSAHGGRIMATKSQNIATKGAYDSVFAPSLPGCSIPWPNGQAAGDCGGAMKLVVTGALAMNGTANASGSPEAHNQGGNAAGGSGGAIDITAGSLSGSGRITADGGSYGWHSGPGGRIAVKLTDKDADFSDFTGLIRATGRSRGSHSGAQGSAGTVYLKTGAESDFGGTLKIACPNYDSMENWNNKTSTTEVVSLGFGGDEIAAMKQVNLVVSDNGRAAVNTDVEFASVTVADATSFIDFEGHTLTVKSAAVGTAKIVAGEYIIPAKSFLEAFPALYNSSEEDGKLVVRPNGTIFILR